MNFDASVPDFAQVCDLPGVISHVGIEREPLICLDDAMRDPHALSRYAAEADFAPASGPAGGYPGIRAPAPPEYVRKIVRAVDPLLRKAFGLENVTLGGAQCSLSLVTLPEAALVASQRVPHVDTTDPLQFAFLHYLCAPELGGTAFYRHKTTGFETLTPERVAQYSAARTSEGADDPSCFAETLEVESRFNRLIVYRSRVFHSGRIPATATRSEDPLQGRLS